MTADAVELVAVDEQVLAELLAVATIDATADEVTPPLTDGPEWTEERRQWFLDYHRARREQLDGPAAEATWAVVHDGRPVGSVRLQRSSTPGVLEAGIWLGRSSRGRGVGTTAMRAVLVEAGASGATAVVADTAATNVAAQTAMRRAGFALAPPGPDGRVRGSVELRRVGP